MEDSPLRLMRFETAVRHDPTVDRWFEEQPERLRELAQSCFAVARDMGDDVRELLHDGHPTACIGDAAFCYVNAFTAHVNVGFFLGAWLDDSVGLLEGTGKRMRHAKLRPGQGPEAADVHALIAKSYVDLQERLRAGAL